MIELHIRLDRPQPLAWLFCASGGTANRDPEVFGLQPPGPPRPFFPAGDAVASDKNLAPPRPLPFDPCGKAGKGRARKGAARRGLGYKSRAKADGRYSAPGEEPALSGSLYLLGEGRPESDADPLGNRAEGGGYTRGAGSAAEGLPSRDCSAVLTVFTHVFLVPWSKSVSGILVRHKSNKSSHKNVKKTVEEDLEEEDTVEEITDSEDEFEDDPSIVKNYKDLEKVVQSFRFDVILKSGLDIARNKVEDAFYNGELRLNGEKLWKKSRSVKVGDTLDLILGEDKETETAVVMRVVLRKASEKNENDKYKVVLRRWKNLKVPKQDVLK
ncbi:hypothetical protein NXF25_002637 [Crotalus adamanteus]|uniref:Mitochondrial transcription rescue factor 1 C-terminal domain-containing protein n=1 Tax=Crotalus adamanteus TaxID=8729 RepID=A0AAW1CCI7_CROAD